jgi:hypothetical protein
VVPGWARALLVLRTAVAPLFDMASYDRATEAEALFQADVEGRGVKAASRPLGAGGEAVAAREEAARGEAEATPGGADEHEPAPTS